jgi:molecular chaperone HtpG
MTAPDSQTVSAPIPFKAETRQLLDILIHSLYSEQEVFLRELISNASDALTRLNFEMLTNREVLDPDSELGIWITVNKEEKTLTLTDTGIGMTAEELAENLGTIAHSGARAFLEAARANQANPSDIIGQFGVGFYSAFMVAESIRVVSRSFRPDAQAAAWCSSGNDTFTVEPAEKIERGTQITIHLKDESAEFADESRIRSIIKKHSDFVPFPIYVGENKEQANQQSAIWRSSAREVDKEKAGEFYRQLTLDMNPPLAYTQINADAPVQLYAMLFLPSSPEKPMFTIRKEDGLKLYARKVLIREYSRDLLPEYFRFVQGVVDSEDIPLNVSREMVQSSRLMGQLKRVITNKVIDLLKDMAANIPDDYAKFWKGFGRFIKEGVATDREAVDQLSPLLRFPTLNKPEGLGSLDEYIAALPDSQKKIYYLLGEDARSAARSPHLDLFRHNGVDVLLMVDPLDSFVLLSLNKYKEFGLVNAAQEKPDLPADEKPAGETSAETLSGDSLEHLLGRIRASLGEKISDVRTTDRLLDSPARLVDIEGAPNEEVQRVYRMLKQEFETPKKVLEINPSHPLVIRLSALAEDDPRSGMVIEQLYENALLVEGLHPDPAGMVARIQELMRAALG